MGWGPWIQDPDIVVQCARARTVGDNGATLGAVHHLGAGYSLSDVNGDVSTTTAPAIEAAMQDNAEDYPFYSIATPPAVTFANVFLDTAPSEYILEGSFFIDCLWTYPYPHDWLAPYWLGTIELEGDGEPVVIEGHVELIHTQELETARSPGHTAPGMLEVYKHTGVDSGHVVPGTRAILGTHGLSWVDSGPAPTFSTVVDLADAELSADGVVFTPFIRISGSSWGYGSVIDNESLRLRVDTNVDVDNSYFVWRPPRYRVFTSNPQPRRLYPRPVTRVYPRPPSPQTSTRTGPAALL